VSLNNEIVKIRPSNLFKIPMNGTIY